MKFAYFKKLYLPTAFSTLVFLGVILGTYVLVAASLRPLYQPSRDFHRAELDLARVMRAAVTTHAPNDPEILAAGRNAMAQATAHLTDVAQSEDTAVTDLAETTKRLQGWFDTALTAGHMPTDDEWQVIRRELAELHFQLELQDLEMLKDTRDMQHKVIDDLAVYILIGVVVVVALWLFNSFWFIPRYAVLPLLDLRQDQQRLEAELEREHAELVTIYDTVPVMIGVVNDSGTVLYSNPAFAKYVDSQHDSGVGLRLGDALGCTHANNQAGGCGFGDPCGSCCLRGALGEALADDGPGRSNFEHHAVLLRKGGMQSFTLLGSAVRLESTKEARVLLCLQDITDRKDTEEALRRSEERMMLALNAASGGWWDWDLQSHDVYYSPRWWQMLGYEPGVLPADEELWQRLMHPDDLDGINEFFQRMLQSESCDYEVEFRHRHADGRYVPVLSQGHILRNEAGLATRVCGFNLDLTETKRKEGEYESLIQTSMDGFWVVDVEGRLLQVNDAICSMLGYPKNTLLKMRVSDIEVLESHTDVIRHVEQIMTVGHDIFESRLRSSNGSVIEVEVSATYLSEAGARVFAFVRDISQRKAFETSLQASESRFRSYIEHAPVGVLVVDARGRYQDANDAAARQLGYTREELLGLSIPDVLAPESLSSGMEHFREIHRGENLAHEVLLRRKDGSVVPMEVQASRLDADRFLGFHIDISERKKAETALLHQAALDAMLAEVSQAMVADEYGAEVAEPIVQHAMHLTGSTLSCLMARGKEPGTVDIVRPGCKDLRLKDDPGDQAAEPDGAIFASLWAQLGPMEAPCTTNVQIDGDSGGEWNVLVLPILQHGEWRGQIVLANAPQGYSATDLSSLSRLGDLYRLHLQGMEIKRELESSRQQFLQAQKMEAIGRLAGGVAHDFNNLLGVIIGYSDFLLKGAEPGGETSEYLESMRKAALRGADLTRQLLAFARKQTVQPRLLDLNESVGAMLKLLGRLAGEQINMHWHPVNRPLQVHIDPSQFDQLLANLVVNARDSMDGNGTITIESACEYVDAEQSARQGRERAPGTFAVLSVTDSGCGMDSETLSRVFEPFFTTKPEGQGTGLGLATVHGIVHQNGGFVLVRSEVGRGTTFQIYIPLQETGTPDHTAMADRVITDPSGTETILLVDDQSDFRDACCRILQCLGYHVITARNGDQALATLNGDAERIQLLITDLVMPGMNGRELWQQLSARCPRLRCIYMSGYTADVIGQQGVLDEKICFIEKPFSMSTLARRIREVLDA